MRVAGWGCGEGMRRWKRIRRTVRVVKGLIREVFWVLRSEVADGRRNCVVRIARGQEPQFIKSPTHRDCANTRAFASAFVVATATCICVL